MELVATSSPVSLLRPHIPSCCKMWFPCTETGGTTLLDIAGAAVLTPTEITHGVTPNAIEFKVVGAGASAYTRGIALTAGSIPAIADKDFILFVVQSHDPDGEQGRVNSVLQLSNDTFTDRLLIFDGDGTSVIQSSVYVAWTETFAGANSDYAQPNATANAIVRNGTSIGNWIQPKYYTESEQGSTVGHGDVYARFIKNAGFVEDTYTNPATFGHWGRNDYNFPNAVIQSWQAEGQTLSGAALSYGDYTFGTSYGGLPGVWCEDAATTNLTAYTKIQVGTALAGANSIYGIALFVFDNGLPSDFKEALRWMNAHWLAGNKEIWPGWADL